MKKTILNPLLALAGCFAAFNGTSTLQAQTTNIWDFNYTGSIVDWTVPQTTIYSITAYGAAGGTGATQSGGLGAVVSGSFQLNAGEVLSLLAGGQGNGTLGIYPAGGGGGSFVVLGATNTPLAVAGGGGGAGYHTDAQVNATTNTTGNNAWSSGANQQGSGGSNGDGGTIGSDSEENGGGGGGGFYTDGGTHLVNRVIGRGDTNVAGGSSYLNGGAGGSGGQIFDGAFVTGGFGGGGQGGAANNGGGGGGGGGWSGGGGGSGNGVGGAGGGGGSFLAAFATNGVMSVGNTSNGSVTITQLIIDLFVGNNASNQGVSFTGGTNIYPSLYQNILVGMNEGDSNNSLTVENASTLLEAVTNVVVGYDGSSNSMTVSNGGKVLAGVGISSGSGIGGVIGYNADSSGNSVLVTGSGSTWSNTGTLAVGYDGSGNSLVISNGGIASNLGQDDGIAVIGYNAGANGNSAQVIGSGSQWTSSSDFFVGFNGAGNSMVVSNSGSVSNAQVNFGGVIGWGTSSSNNTALVTGTGSTWNNSGDLTLGMSGSGNTLTVSAGATVVNGQVTHGGVIGFSASSSNNTALVTGTGSTWNNSGDLTLGMSGSGNTLTVSAGATVVNGQVTHGGVIGFSASSSNNTALVTGNGSAWNNGSNLTVGYDGSGNSLVIEAGASVTTAGHNAPTGGVPVGGILGYKAGSSGNSVLVTGSGSSWINDWNVGVGYDGSSNSLVVSNGGQVSATYSYIGRNAVSSNNSVLVTGSGSRLSMTENILIGESGSGNSLVISDGGSVSSLSAYIGANAGSSNNSVLVTGSGSSLSNNSFYGTNIGYAGEGTLTVANGGVAASTEPQGITVASQAGSIGTLNIGGFGSNDAAGTINAPKIGFGAGTGTINFNQSDTTTPSTVISGHGSVNQLGSGTTILTGNYAPGGNTYSGTTTVSAGTLLASSASGSSAIGSSTLMVNNTGTFGGKGVVQGAATIASGGTLAVGLNGVGSLSFNGGLTLEAGSTTIFQLHSAGDFTSIYLSGGRVNYGGALVFSLVDFTPVVGDQFDVFNLIGAAESGNFSSVEVGSSDLSDLNGLWSGMNAGVTYEFNVTTGILAVQAVPSSASGSVINNSGTGGTPTWMDFTVNGSATTATGNNTIRSLTFANNGNLAIQAGHSLTLSQGQVAVQNGTSLVSGGTLVTPGNFNKTGTGELDVQSTLAVNGTASIDAGLLSVNGQLIADSVVVNPNATLGGAGFIVGNVNVNGNFSPGNSPGTLTITGNLALTGANSTLIEIASPTNFDRIVISGSANLGGALNVVEFGGFEIAYGQQYAFLTAAGGISGEFDTITAPETFRGRFLNSGTVGTILIAPDTYTRVAVTPNQRNVAKALDSFIPATSGDRETVSIALDLQTAEQYPSAFDQIMPGFYESLANIAIEQAFAQTQMLNQRISSVRLGAAGFQAIGGISQPLMHDKNGKSAADAKNASPIVESATATNWNSWALGTGMFSRSTNLPNLQNYNNDAGGFLVGTDYRWSENFVSGLYAGYDYSYAEYNGGGSTKGNSVNFGTYASYAKDGYYADAVIGGGYTAFQTKRSIQFSTIDRTASADPGSGQFTAGINLGKDFEVGKFTLGPIIGAQYTYAGIGSFTESGAESLDLSLGQQNANSLRSTLGGRIAYTWNLNQKIALIPEVRMFWQHEFLNNERNINASLDGGNGAAFDFETGDPYRNSVFAGAGVTAHFGERWNASLFYNVNFGSQTYQSNMVSAGLNFSF